MAIQKFETKEEIFEEFGQQLDKLENLIAALKMPVPDSIHRSAMLGTLPDLHSQFKQLYFELGGEDVWSI